MDFELLAKELMEKIKLSQKPGHKFMQDGVHGEGVVLYCIREKQDDIVPSEISSVMGISGARVAAVLSSLESKGLITREIDVNDRRRILVKLTQKGEEFEAEHRRKHLGKITEVLTLLGESDAREYVRIMGRLAELMSNTNLC